MSLKEAPASLQLNFFIPQIHLGSCGVKNFKAPRMNLLYEHYLTQIIHLKKADE